MKHGVVIREDERWNTKTVYNNGHVMWIYRRQPKEILFRSTMINDLNQHLCGGWFLPEIPDTTQTTIDQLIGGRKPFGSMAAESRIDFLEQQLNRAGLHTQKQAASYLVACHDIRVCDIGNLESLKEDYKACLGAEYKLVLTQMDEFANVPLQKFFGGWDSPPLPLWLTGLILGYPIENTISIYRETE